MIGHRSPRYLRFGWAAARLDDLANWVPARVDRRGWRRPGRRWWWHSPEGDPRERRDTNIRAPTQELWRRPLPGRSTYALAAGIAILARSRIAARWVMVARFRSLDIARSSRLAGAVPSPRSLRGRSWFVAGDHDHRDLWGHRRSAPACRCSPDGGRLDVVSSLAGRVKQVRNCLRDVSGSAVSAASTASRNISRPNMPLRLWTRPTRSQR